MSEEMNAQDEALDETSDTQIRRGEGWRTPRDTSNDPSREAGPIELNRYSSTMAFSGLGTFMGVPVCLTQDDLKAGGVDAAVVGAPIDMGTAMRGAAYGPRYIRMDERILPNSPEYLQNPDTRIKPFDTLKVVDYGDAPVNPLDYHESLKEVRNTVREVAETGAMPIVLGGDHGILWPDAAAMADVYGPGKVGVIHLDKHADCANTSYGHLISHGTPIRRLIDDEHIPAKNFVQIGLYSYVMPDDELFDWMNEKGMRSHYLAEIDRIGFDAVLEKAIDEALDGPEYIFLSLDIDVLDPAFAPGTGTPEAGGLTPRELLPAMRRLCHETPVVGMEVVEVAPFLDPGYTTAMYARKSILEALTGVAQRKLGLPTPNYLHPKVAGLE
ncbi:MAG: agmatinase family protein [Chloroflexota bacterium]